MWGSIPRDRIARSSLFILASENMFKFEVPKTVMCVTPISEGVASIDDYHYKLEGIKEAINTYEGFNARVAGFEVELNHAYRGKIRHDESYIKIEGTFNGVNFPVSIDNFEITFKKVENYPASHEHVLRAKKVGHGNGLTVTATKAKTIEQLYLEYNQAQASTFLYKLNEKLLKNFWLEKTKPGTRVLIEATNWRTLYEIIEVNRHKNPAFTKIKAVVVESDNLVSKPGENNVFFGDDGVWNLKKQLEKCVVSLQ